jgi:hypothetical protein
LGAGRGRFHSRFPETKKRKLKETVEKEKKFDLP